MIEENIVGPNELLDKFKLYEYILNVDKKALIKELFKGEQKAPLEKLRESVTHYDKAYFEIMTLANDVVEFPLFRVMTKDMKEGLGKACLKIKQTLLEQINNYCKDSVAQIYESYEDMNKQILFDPSNERELVQTRDFIKDAPNKVEKLSTLLHEVYKHYLLLEDFSFKYDDKEIEAFWG